MIVGIVVGILTTFIGGSALSWSQSKEAQLVFEDNETLPIQNKDQSTAIYHVTFLNVGSKEAEDVTCVVSLPNASVSNHNVSCPASMMRVEEKKEDYLSENFKIFNPGEKVQISVLANSKTTLPVRPEVSFRGKGVTGISNRNQSTRQSEAGTVSAYVNAYLPTLIVPILISLGFSMYSIYNFFAKRIAYFFGKNQIEIEVMDNSRIKIRVLKGFAQPKEWMSLKSGDKHEPTGLSFNDLLALGNGTHHILTK